MSLSYKTILSAAFKIIKLENIERIEMKGWR